MNTLNAAEEWTRRRKTAGSSAFSLPNNVEQPRQLFYSAPASNSNDTQTEAITAGLTEALCEHAPAECVVRPKRPVSLHRQRSRQRRKAKFLIEKIEQIPIEQRTGDDRRTVAWAIRVLEGAVSGAAKNPEVKQAVVNDTESSRVTAQPSNTHQQGNAILNTSMSSPAGLAPFDLTNKSEQLRQVLPSPLQSTGNDKKKMELTAERTDACNAFEQAFAECVALPNKPVPTNRQRARRRQKAKRLIKEIEQIPSEQRSAKDWDSLAWAASILAQEVSNAVKKPEMTPTLSNDMLNSRVPQNEDAKPSDNKQDGIVLAVVDRGHVDGDISPENWTKLLGAVQEQFLAVLKSQPGPPPGCIDAGWTPSKHKLMAFADQRSVGLFEMALTQVGELWPGAKFQLLHRHSLPNRPRGRIKIPEELSSAQQILDMAQVSNPQLPTDDWRVIKIEEPKEGFRHVTLLITEKSAKLVARLNNRIAFGFATIPMYVYRIKTKQKTANNSQAPCAAFMDDKPACSEVIQDNSENPLPRISTAAATSAVDNKPHYCVLDDTILIYESDEADTADAAYF